MTSRPVAPGESPDTTAIHGETPDGIHLLMRVLEEFRKLDPDLPIQYALSFLTLATNEGLSLGELATRLGIAQSSASRNVAALSAWHSFGKPGLDLVEAREDPRERRRKLVTLTSKGHALVETLRDILDPAPATVPDIVSAAE
jgi:DNA-binding MarR family transcriptional regulator